MTEQKPCVRCGKPIDRYARMCVYCNWDQSETPPSTTGPAAPPPYVPPPDHRARNKILAIAAFAGALILAFVIGTLIHGFEPSEAKAAPNKEAAAPRVSTPVLPRSNVTLVPFTGSDSSPAVEEPVTSAPPQAPGQLPTDATALPSSQYASVAAKAKAQKQQAEMIDPRTLRGHAYDAAEQPRDAGNPPMSSASTPPTVEHTDAYPEYKPLPDIHVMQDTDARLSLDVDSDGRVGDVEVLDPVPGATGQLVQAIQNWRFRPATVNGTPVPAKVTVTITLHANE